MSAVTPDGSADASTSTTFASALGQAVTDPMAAVTLGEMVSIRSGTSSNTGTISTLGALGLGQAAQILRAGYLSTERVGSSGRSSLNVPAALQAYGNGRVPRDMLTLIGIGQHRLWSPAADAFKKMRAAAAADGVTIGVTDSYRSYDEQVDLAGRKGLYQNGGYAAVPGTSPHGWGLALDVDVDPKGLAWLRAHGSEYDFVEAVPREPWHWEFHGAT